MKTIIDNFQLKYMYQRTNIKDEDEISNIQERYIADEVISPTLSVKNKLNPFEKLKFMKVIEKIEKYDTAAKADLKLSNPLLKNKG